jgi:hypothetical protein
MIAWLIVALMGVAAQDHRHADLTRRGEAVMGFDQTTTTHHFRLTAQGGDIEVTANDAKDSASIAQIRTHLQHIAKSFAAGNFTAPRLIHAKEPPGVKAMKRGGDRIAYSFEEIERGGIVKMTTASPTLRAAVQEFLRFQIKDHQTGDPIRY